MVDKDVVKERCYPTQRPSNEANYQTTGCPCQQHARGELSQLHSILADFSACLTCSEEEAW